MAAVWAYARWTRNIGYVDVAWAALMGLMMVVVSIDGRGALLPRALIGGLGAAWALRLCLHLFGRVHRKPEDGRYAQLREHWQGHQVHLFLFFQAQAVVVMIFTVPLLVAAANPVTGISGWIIAGVAIWLLSVGGEALADRQLSAWRGDPMHSGKTCRSGLWAWSRHPNYFFEWLHWSSYALFAVGAPHAWLAWIGPVLMFVFLYRITGIPYAEAQALRSRGDDYRGYQREVSAFFPWPPRHPSLHH
jgi:steroid 5-alpha reductase family enzyme